jgi:hypothetical protein
VCRLHLDFAMKRTPMRSPPRSTGPDKLTIEALYLRSEGLCEGCGEPLQGERGAPHGHAAHHRRARRMGGSQAPDTNSIENLLMLGHNCHLWVERYRSAATRWGFLVPQTGIPAAVPVWLYGVPAMRRGETTDSLMLLTDDAGYRPVETVEVPDA